LRRDYYRAQPRRLVPDRVAALDLFVIELAAAALRSPNVQLIAVFKPPILCATEPLGGLQTPSITFPITSAVSSTIGRSSHSPKVELHAAQRRDRSRRSVLGRHPFECSSSAACNVDPFSLRFSSIVATHHLAERHARGLTRVGDGRRSQRRYDVDRESTRSRASRPES
jgi:hypothetical protein